MTHQVCFTLECRNQRISSTSALIMLSHNDRGISALIMGDPLYIEHMALKADSSWPDKQGAFIHMSMVFHGPSSCQNSRRSDKKWTKNNVPNIRVLLKRWSCLTMKLLIGPMTHGVMKRSNLWQCPMSTTPSQGKHRDALFLHGPEVPL